MQSFGKRHVTIREIEEKFEDGEFREVEEDLEAFLRDRADQIMNLRDSLRETFDGTEVTLPFAVKMYIQQIRSINPESEISEELEEIRSEIRKRHSESGEAPSREEIINQWCEKYAPSWRDNHVLAVIYVFDRNRDRYTDILRESADT